MSKQAYWSELIEQLHIEPLNKKEALDWEMDLEALKDGPQSLIARMNTWPITRAMREYQSGYRNQYSLSTDKDMSFGILKTDLVAHTLTDAWSECKVRIPTAFANEEDMLAFIKVLRMTHSYMAAISIDKNLLPNTKDYQDAMSCACLLYNEMPLTREGLQRYFLEGEDDRQEARLLAGYKLNSDEMFSMKEMGRNIARLAEKYNNAEQQNDGSISSQSIDFIKENTSSPSVKKQSSVSKVVTSQKQQKNQSNPTNKERKMNKQDLYQKMQTLREEQGLLADKRTYLEYKKFEMEGHYNASRKLSARCAWIRDNLASIATPEEQKSYQRDRGFLRVLEAKYGNQFDHFLNNGVMEEMPADNRSEVVETMEIDGLPVEIYGSGLAVRKENDGTETQISIGFVRDMDGILRKDLLKESNESADGIKTEKYIELKKGAENIIRSEREDKAGNVVIEENIPETVGPGRDKNGILKNNIRRAGKKQVMSRYADGSQNLRQEEDGKIKEVFSDGNGNKTEKTIAKTLEGEVLLEERQTSKDGSKTEKTFSLNGNVLSEVHTSNDGSKITKRMNRDGKVEVESRISKDGDEEVKYYDDKGQLALTTTKNRKGIEVEYDKDGKLQKLTIRRNGTTTVRTGLLARLSAVANKTPRRLEQRSGSER